MRKNKISSRGCPSKPQPFVVVDSLLAASRSSKRKYLLLKKTAVYYLAIACAQSRQHRFVYLLVTLTLSILLSRAAGSFRYSCDICGKKYKYYSCFQEHRDLHAVDGNPGCFSSVYIVTFELVALQPSKLGFLHYLLAANLTRTAPTTCKVETLNNAFRYRTMHE